MTCGNPIKHKLQQVVDNWLDMLRDIADALTSVHPKSEGDSSCC